MIIEDPEEKKELDEISNVDENGEPIYKIDSDASADTLPEPGEFSSADDDSDFKGTPQDLKDENSQE